MCLWSPAAAVWLATTGLVLHLAASRLVRQPEWATSAMTATRFSSAMASRPDPLGPAVAAVGGVAAAVAEHVAALIGHMHQADAKLEEDRDVAQLVGHRHPVLREGDAVAGQIKALFTSPLGGGDTVRRDGPGYEIAEH